MKCRVVFLEKRSNAFRQFQSIPMKQELGERQEFAAEGQLGCYSILNTWQPALALLLATTFVDVFLVHDLTMDACFSLLTAYLMRNTTYLLHRNLYGGIVDQGKVWNMIQGGNIPGERCVWVVNIKFNAN